MYTLREVGTLRSVFLLFVSCFLICLANAQSARADDIPPGALPPEWNVSGTASIVGNDACSGLPCTETIAFSFDVGYQFLSSETPPYEAYYTDLVMSGSGALGSFTGSVDGPLFLGTPSFSPPGECFGLDNNYLGLADPGGDSFNIHLCTAFASAPTAPALNGVDLYGCGTSQCAADFSFNPSAPLPQLGLFVYGPVEYTVTPLVTPEPSMLSLLAVGLIALGLAGALRKFRVFELA